MPFLIKRKSNAAFTLAELSIAAAVSAGVAIALGAFSLVSARLAGRNLASNHGHSSIATANQRLLREAQASGSAFQLMSFDGTTYTDSSNPATTDQDPFSKQYLSARSNVVKYWKVAGGPYQMTQNTTPTSTSLKFNFGPAVNGVLPYVPAVNDKLYFALLDREFKITAVTTVPIPSSPNGVITIHDTAGIGYTIDTASPNVTTALFFRQAAFSVWNNQLRFHANFVGTSQNTYVVVHDMITSPKPFSILYPTSSSATSDSLTLRVSLEAYDLNYSKPQYPNASTTMQTCISVRNQPPFVSLSQTPQ